mgnify:CR=1 FL=1
MDEKAMTVIDVSGCGSGAVFLIKGKCQSPVRGGDGVCCRSDGGKY